MKYLAAFLVSTLAMSAGCTGPCERGEYSAGLVISVENIEAPASYRMEVEADGTLLVLEYSVDVDRPLTCNPSCTSRAGDFVLEPELAYDLGGWAATEVRFAVHRADDRDDGPSDVTLRVYRDTQLA